MRLYFFLERVCIPAQYRLFRPQICLHRTEQSLVHLMSHPHYFKGVLFANDPQLWVWAELGSFTSYELNGKIWQKKKQVLYSFSIIIMKKIILLLLLLQWNTILVVTPLKSQWTMRLKSHFQLDLSNKISQHSYFNSG